MLKDSLQAHLHFVSGKGGVGKSTFACVLGRYFENQGLKTLLVQINAEDVHSRYLGSSSIGHEFVSISRDLWAINLDPQECLKEYLLLKIKSERLYSVLFNNRVMHSLFRFTPSLAELNMLGKIWFHACEEERGRPRFDRIVVDCPATGHGLRFLSVPRVIEKGVLKGPIAKEAEQMRACFEDGKKSRLHIVTLAEDMPVKESLEMLKILDEEALMQLGFVVVNAFWEPLFTQQEASVLEQVASKSLREVGMRRLLKEKEQEEELMRLRQKLKAKQLLHLPFWLQGKLDAKGILSLARDFETQHNQEVEA